MTDGDKGRLEISGPVLVTGAHRVRQAGLDAIASGTCAIDLGGVTSADSSGIAVILSWLRAAKVRGETLTLTNVPPSLRNLAEVYGVGDLIS